MTQVTIIKKVKESIKEGNGIFDLSFWRGYCRAYDDFKNLVPGSTWGIIKDEIFQYSRKFKGNILIK